MALTADNRFLLEDEEYRGGYVIGLEGRAYTPTSELREIGWLDGKWERRKSDAYAAGFCPINWPAFG